MQHMATATQLGFTQDSFDAFLAARDEPTWLTDARRAAWQHFQQSKWPARNHEEWMRTDIRLFKLDRYSPPQLSGEWSSHVPGGLLCLGVALAGHNRSLDSHSLDYTLHKNWSDRGVLFGSLDKMLADHDDLLRPHFHSAFDPTHDRFASLHAAFWTGGQLLYVPRGVVVDEPLHVLSSMTDGGTDLGHVLVVLEDGAEATLLCETSSPSETAGGFHCGAVELILGSGSHLRFVNFQDWGHGVWHFAHQQAIVHSDATLQWTVAALGSRLAKVNQRVLMVGEGASCQVNGVLFTEGNQHLSYDTLQHHKAANCRSDFLYKTALQDKSRTVWRGMIKVDVDAQKTDGYQRNDNLLLSGNARADSIPGLEIEADDVRCTHGSTSGCVDEELIFYAGCRGFTRKEAVQMIVTGFFQHIFDRITIENVREALALAIARRVREYE